MAKKTEPVEPVVETEPVEPVVDDYAEAMRKLEAGELKHKVLTSRGWVLPR